MTVRWTLLFLRCTGRSHVFVNLSKHQYRCCTSHPSANKKSNPKVDMKKYPASNIRNFGIIAHVDHGKSTLSDRLMEFAGNISKEGKHEQVLDKLQVERERGITVKAQTVSLFYEHNGQSYLLNLIDTPVEFQLYDYIGESICKELKGLNVIHIPFMQVFKGHVDFSYEVNRSLSACQGVLLLVDANQGVQAQTVANFNIAYGHELAIIPILNKIDLKNANPDAVSTQMNSLFGISKEETLKVSAKLGLGIEELMAAIVERIPPPKGNAQKPFRALLYDSWFSPYRGAVCMVVIIDGSIAVGDNVTSHLTGHSYEVKELGILYPEEIPVNNLYTGQTGYIIANIRTLNEAKIGDTWFLKESPVDPLPQVATSKPMVFAGIFPSDQSKYQVLRKSVEKLTLNDSSVTIAQETSPALGLGWRLGFLGLLHMEVFCQRLDQEFDAQVIVTAPGVPYKVKIKGEKNIKDYGDEELIVTNPLKFPEPSILTESFEPMVLGTIITPDTYYSSILKLCLSRRGIHKGSQNVDEHTMMLMYKFPLSEIIVDFFDDLKSVSSGFASFDYEEIGYEPSNLVKMTVLLNGKIVDELTVIIHLSQAQSIGRAICLSLKDNIKPHMFLIAVQAAIGGKIVARENIKPLKKNVTAKLYGGDVTRRMKLLQRQSEGKKRMRMIGNVEVPRDAFIKVLKR